MWYDGPPILLFCSSGQKYVLMRVKVFHGLPAISQEELKALVAAFEDLTVTGSQWSYHEWQSVQERDKIILRPLRRKRAR